MTDKKYYDSDGNECTLYHLVRREPEWAVNIIETKLGKIERQLELTREYATARLCMDHQGKWERGRCVMCELESALRRAQTAEADWQAAESKLDNYREVLESLAPKDDSPNHGIVAETGEKIDIVHALRAQSFRWACTAADEIERLRSKLEHACEAGAMERMKWQEAEARLSSKANLESRLGRVSEIALGFSGSVDPVEALDQIQRICMEESAAEGQEPAGAVRWELAEERVTNQLGWRWFDKWYGFDAAGNQIDVEFRERDDNVEPAEEVSRPETVADQDRERRWSCAVCGHSGEGYAPDCDRYDCPVGVTEEVFASGGVPADEPDTTTTTTAERAEIAERDAEPHGSDALPEGGK